MRIRNQTHILLSCTLLLIGLLPIMAIGAEPSLLSIAAEKARHATVGILSPEEERATISGPAPFSVRGSGTHIGQGYILTARHAIEHQKGGKTLAAEAIQVITEHFHELTATFIGINEFLDVALYRVPEDTLPDIPGQVTFAESEAYSGDNVFTVGYPLGWGPALSFGRIGNPHTFLTTIQSRLLQVDLSACSGNSGGGLFNTKGEIVGVVHAIIQTEHTQGERRCSRFAFAVPGLIVQKIVQSLIEGHSLKFSTLGISLNVVKQDRHWAIAVKNATGPARRAGFKKGDILLAINHQPIHSAAQLKNYLIEHTQPEQNITITILREQETLNLNVILGES
ncbi:S1C family serine protease [Candidatus Nitronereus thalassa]|uniref:Trypsin-like peptidase domain-containing protein n=1 Tax=Candidatus Nitronereus thalassa TaxID=3020898 RepID=A0ABU3K516_9BACT|nr:trypsin-like peptidase domain-containing protein [Candidatus Nitronereus thalassa]MDT7041500.1 trypsin-like peptidase domain-containing protein [Candidatus Nitronereus thalassa]